MDRTTDDNTTTDGGDATAYRNLPLLPLRSGVVLPGMVFTVALETDEARAAAEAAEAADGHVVHANHAARVELAGAKSLQLVGRRLSGRSAIDQRALDDALAGARDGGKRRMLAFAPADALSEGKSCDLSIVPLPAALSSNRAGHAVLIALPRSRIAETLSVDAYARELGLSRREQQVLAGLCEGLRVKEIAAKLEIGDETVRSHVKRLKAKTGCAGIVDIVNQVSRLPPMVGALRQTPAELPRADERA